MKSFDQAITLSQLQVAETSPFSFLVQLNLLTLQNSFLPCQLIAPRWLLVFSSLPLDRTPGNHSDASQRQDWKKEKAYLRKEI